MRRYAQIVACALCLAPSRSHAQDRVLVVRADPGDEVLAEEIARWLTDAWRAEGNRVRRPEASSPLALPPPLEVARAEYDELRPAHAVERLEGWLAQVDTHPPELDRTTYVEALVWLALARLANGDAGGGDAALARALAADPELELAEDAYPPTVRERLSVARAAMASATLRLRSAPPGAEVTIDGSPRGETPLALELGVGPHVVQMSEPSHASHAELLALGPDGAEVSWTLRPDPGRRLLHATSADDAALGAARELGGALVWIDVHCGPDGCRARLDDRAGPRRVSAGPSRSAAQLARELLAPAPIELPVPTIENDAEEWPWIVLGVAAGAAAFVAVVLSVFFASQTSGWDLRLEEVP